MKDVFAGFLQVEKFAQAPGLGAANGDLGLLLVVHPELKTGLEPRNHLSNPVDVDEIGAVHSPENVRVEI